MLKKTFSQWLGGNKKMPVNNTPRFPWNDLLEMNQLGLEEPIGDGEIKVVFKHSTRCGISSMMLRRFEEGWIGDSADKQFFLLDLIRHRQISNAIADSFNVPHQSPQVLILKDGVLISAKSHGDISSLMPNDFK